MRPREEADFDAGPLLGLRAAKIDASATDAGGSASTNDAGIADTAAGKKERIISPFVLAAGYAGQALAMGATEAWNLDQARSARRDTGSARCTRCDSSRRTRSSC